MGSTYVDDFVLNFDLNHLHNEESVQTSNQKYEVLSQKYDKLRKSTSWLKSKIISTDFAIQKYQVKKDDYEQSVKAHALTREELKQVCITYKDASEMCAVLQNENKLLLANQEVLKQNIIDAGNKYDAIISHTNQLQMLVKQLEIEKDALNVERELDKFNNKDSKEEIIVLQKEKDAILKDLIALTDVILSKQKANKKHIKIIKKYVKDIKCKGSKILCTTPEESDDDMDRYISSQTKINLKIHNVADKEAISSTEQNSIDNYSDGEVSVDTGRGSSRANSHDKYLNSPDYAVNLETPLKLPPKNVIKHVDVGNSPITVYPPRSVATSPIIFHDPITLLEDQYDDYADCFDGPEYIIDDVPFSEEIDILVEQEKLAGCDSPVPDQTNFDSETSPSKNYDNSILKETGGTFTEKSLFIDPLVETKEFDQDLITEKYTPRYLCEKCGNHMIHEKKKMIDACTSPVLISSSLRNFVDTGTNTAVPDESINIHKSKELEIASSRNCKQSMCTDTVIMSEKKEYVNACTSPIPKSFDYCKFVDIGTNTVNRIGCKNPQSNNCDKSTNTITLPEKKLVDASTYTDLISPSQCKVVDKEEMGVVSNQQKEKSRKSVFNNQEELPVIDCEMSSALNKTRFSKSRDNTISNPTQELRTPEKVCLETNSCQNLHFESTNDSEVQNILNVMRLHHDLISPISNHQYTPPDSQYLKLIPEMNCTLKKIWTTIESMYRMPKHVINYSNSLNSSEVHDLEEISEETNNREKNSDQEQLGSVRLFNQDLEDDTIGATNSINVARDDASTDNTYSTQPNMPINEDSNVITSNRSDTDTCANKLLPNSNIDNVIVIVEEVNKCPQEQQISNSSDLNKMYENTIHNTNNTEENMLLEEEDDKEKRDTQQNFAANYSEKDESCEDNVVSNNANNIEKYNITEACTGRTIIINGTKTRKKSKLEKLRQKMLPTSKIKKINSPSKKHSSKACNIKPKNNPISSSLNQKLAYENAVKVMAEIRSNQELQKNKKKPLKVETGDTNMESKSNVIESPTNETFERNILTTRSRTRKLSKKEDTTVTVNPEENQKEIEKSPINRNLRKRPANTEVDNCSSNCKRILRSSMVSQITNTNILPVLQSENSANCKKYMKNVSYSDCALSQYLKPMGEAKNDNLNLKSQICSPKNVHIEPAKSNKTNENTRIKKTKPVIELSKCLADNANLVSIVPGNVGYVDVNKDSKTKKPRADFSSDIESVQNNHSKMNQLNLEYNKGPTFCSESIKVTQTSTDEASKILMETKNHNSTNINENSNDERNQLDHITTQKNPKISIQQSIHVQHNPIPNTKQYTNSLEHKLREEANIGTKNPVVQLIPLRSDTASCKNEVVSYSDLDLFEIDRNVKEKILNAPPSESRCRKENILCAALDRYGVISVKYTAKKVPDSITLQICQQIEESIPKIIASPKAEQKNKMDELVNYIQTFKIKHILAGLMKYLKDPSRKNELFSKIINGPAPAMTKPEVILLYVIETLNGSLPSGFIKRLWNNIEHALFQLNRTPDFNVIESMSHFYAVLCRYFRNKSRLRCFMLDAMYCLQFKAVPLIRQCLEVCPGVLPNAHERMAKTSLVTCLVYLLHFYKCQDKFNRAQDIRNILYRKYQYRFSEWNETMILEIFRKAIMDLRGTHNDKKMLRVALIILCKRHGPKWCQLNIIQNILLPIIEKKDVPERIKQFCVLMLGPLLKPFPADRKAQCEIVINQLLQMLKQNPSQEIKEAIYSSLIFVNKHDQERVVQALLSWNPDNVSPEFKEILNDFVMEKPLAVWKKLVTRKPSQCT